MSKRVLILSTSLRKGSNSDLLAEEFAKGAEQTGNFVEKISLYHKTIGFCKGCLSCQETKCCMIHDDANEIVQKMKKADVIVFATPIYYYEMCGQMKTLLDRSNPLFFLDYSFREIYLLATSADTEKSAMDGAIKGIQGWVSCFEKSELKGIVYGVGADKVGSIKTTSALKEAYEMGKAV